MKSIFKSVLTMAAGMLIGAGATGALMAQTPAAPQAYLVANITAVTDAASYKQYQDNVAKSQVPFGGHGIVRAAVAEKPGAEGDGWANLPQGHVTIIAFPSMEKLKAWWSSADYDRIRPFREKGTTGTVYAVEGLRPHKEKQPGKGIVPATKTIG